LLTDEEATRLTGSTLVSAEDEDLGTIETVLTHAADNRAAWAVTSVGDRAVAVPLDGARLEGGRLLVRYEAQRITSAPEVEGDALDAEAAQRLYAHYGIDDSTLRDNSGFATEEGTGGTDSRSGDPRGGAGADDRTQGHP